MVRRHPLFPSMKVPPILNLVFIVFLLTSFPQALSFLREVNGSHQLTHATSMTSCNRPLLGSDTSDYIQVGQLVPNPVGNHCILLTPGIYYVLVDGLFVSRDVLVHDPTGTELLGYDNLSARFPATQTGVYNLTITNGSQMVVLEELIGASFISTQHQVNSSYPQYGYFLDNGGAGSEMVYLLEVEPDPNGNVDLYVYRSTMDIGVIAPNLVANRFADQQESIILPGTSSVVIVHWQSGQGDFILRYRLLGKAQMITMQGILLTTVAVIIVLAYLKKRKPSKVSEIME